MHVYLLDDEPLAVRRLRRLIDQAGHAAVTVAGASSDPLEALAWLNANSVDVLFLDIEMPELNGFELLARLESPPLLVFTTAYDQYALRAFQANSIDYLLKPIEAGQLLRALNKLERMLAGSPAAQNVAGLLGQFTAKYPARLASRTGDKVEFVEVGEVTHFYAKDKLTFAATPGRHYVIDHSIAELEQRLDPVEFFRIHRGALVRLPAIRELHSWFAGGVVVRLKDPQGSELSVARDRVPALKQRLGL